MKTNEPTFDNLKQGVENLIGEGTSGSAWMFYNHYNPELLKAMQQVLVGHKVEDVVNGLLEGDPRTAFKPSVKMSDRKFQQGQKTKKSTAAWKLKDFSASIDDENNDFVEGEDSMCGGSCSKCQAGTCETGKRLGCATQVKASK